MSRSLDNWIAYIQTLHARSIDLGLERVARVWLRSRPDSLPPVITVAGTNGKGSSVSMLESIYRHAGYRTASFTSPHLVRFNERFRLDNQPVADESLLAAFERVEQCRQSTPLTFFEYNTLIAMDLFTRNQPDVIILEVGMGGRLDAVNMVPNDLALITAIGLDHTDWLGETLEQIAREKGGVIKTGGRAVLADPNSPKSLVECAKERGADYVQAGLDYQLHDSTHGVGYRFFSADERLNCFNGVPLPDAQPHVLDNTQGVIASVAMLNEMLPVSRAQLETGLSCQSLSGRLELIASEPRVLLDVAHNQASVMAMIEFIDGLNVQGQVLAVFGALGDKDYGEVGDMLKSRVDHWYLCSLEGERGQRAAQLGQRMFCDSSTHDLPATVSLHDSPQAAYEQARIAAQKHDLIVIFGSFHVVGAIIPHLKN